MMKMNMKLNVFLAVLLLSSVMASGQTNYLEEAQNKICDVLQQLYELLVYIAGGLGALVIVAQGVSWVASADDAKARKSAKTAVIHVIIGLIIVSISLMLVAVVLPDGAGCVTDWPGWPTTPTP